MLVTPFVEECVFRNWLLRGFERSMRSRHAAAWATSALFALGHAGYWPFWPVAGLRLVNIGFLLAGSVIAARLTQRTCGCWAGALMMHVSYNATSFVTLIWAAHR